MFKLKTVFALTNNGLWCFLFNHIVTTSTDIKQQINTWGISIQLTCDKRLISHGMSFDYSPIDWKLPSRDDFHHVTSLHQLNIHLLLTGKQTSGYSPIL